MTVSEYIFDYLQKKGLDTVYMVSGSSSMWLTDALYKNKKLKAICCHHEQAAAMAADGYGRVRGLPGACLVTIGPGATNAITGVAQAYLDSSPMFVLSGQANSKLFQYQVETGIRQNGTQSLNLQPIVSSITKYFCVVMDPTDITSVMDEAYEAAMSGRRGPVWLDIPVDVQNKQLPEIKIETSYDDNSTDIAKKIIQKEQRRNSDILKEYSCIPNYYQIIEDIKRAEKPLILAGAGIRMAGACDELLELAEKFSVPVVTSRGGIDVVPTNCQWFVGRPGAYGDRTSHFAISQCDYLLILGSRLSTSTIGYYPQRFGEHAYKVMVDIDPLELDRDAVKIQKKYCMNVQQFLNELLEASDNTCLEKTKKEGNKNHYKWNQYLKELQIKYPIVCSDYQTQEPLNEYYVTDCLARMSPENANIIVDTGSVCNVVSQTWKVKKGQKYLISGGLSSMGFWATSIGAYESGKALLAITGDGSAQMNIQEFATLKTNNIPLKLFIYQNHGYMLIRHNQHNYMNDRFLGVGTDSGVETPNFVKVAQAYGLKAYRIERLEELEDTLAEVIASKEPTICEIICKEFAPIIPRIASKVMEDGSLKAAEFDDLYPFLSGDEYRNALYKG